MNRYISAFAVAAAMLTTGCSVIPQYQMPAGAETAQLKLSSKAAKLICVSGERHKLVPDAAGYATIAAGSRQTIVSVYNNYVYQGISTYCTARSSFVPQAGQKYFIDFEMEADRCFAIPFKESNANRTGLEIEPTMAPSMECATVK